MKAEWLKRFEYISSYILVLFIHFLHKYIYTVIIYNYIYIQEVIRSLII